MKKIAVVYWSGTGNTESMAQAVAAGVDQTAVQVQVLSVDQASVDAVQQADAIALGCPAMGNEVLEEYEMEPFVAALGTLGLQQKPLVLFGSYDWGNGEWMRDWEAKMQAYGARLLQDGLIVHNTPGDDDVAACRQLGAALATALT